MNSNSHGHAAKKAVTLLSGGLDSLIATLKAAEQYNIVQALTVDYGQRAAQREITAAKALCEFYGWAHQVVFLPLAVPQALQRTDLAHIACASEVVESKEQRTDGVNATTRSVWVPNRNGVLLNWAAAVAESMGADAVVFGANATEAQTFPDNTLAFTEAMTHSLHFSTLNHVQVLSPVVAWTKADMIGYANQNQVPLQFVWSCYEAGEISCGRCPSCLLRQEAETLVKASVSVKF